MQSQREYWPDFSILEKVPIQKCRMADIKGRPSLKDLQEFPYTIEGSKKIMQQIASNYKSIGAYLLKDTDGSVLAGIEQSYQSKSVDIIREILGKWLREDPDSSWEKFIECLRHSECDALAKKLEDSLLKYSKTSEGTSIKRKQEQIVPGPAKKLAVDRSENDEPISFTSEKCSTYNSDNIVKGAVAAYNGNVYFGSGDAIHVLNVNHKKPRWFPKIQCNRTHFGLTALGDTLLAVGGLLKSSPGENTATNTVQCYALCSKDASKERTWEEKYPAMGMARFDPEVVNVGNYVIVIAGWTELVGEYERNNPVLAVEILDVNREKWYSIKSMALPNEINSLEWQSACICNDTLYLAVKHDDPEYDKLKDNSSDIDEDSNSGFPFGSESDKSDCYPEKPYKCYSLYECSLEDLSQLAEMSEHDQSAFSWQNLNHPHPAVYVNENEERMCTSYVGLHPSEDDIQEYHSKGGLDSNYVQTEFFTYKYCKFTLSCIGNHLIAVGCKHVAAIAPGDMRYSLNRTYESYKVIMASLFRYDDEPYETPIDYVSETIEETECHVHIYDPDKDSWKQLYSTQNPHGHSDNQSLVTAVDNKLVIVRGLKAACVCTFDLK